MEKVSPTHSISVVVLRRKRGVEVIQVGSSTSTVSSETSLGDLLQQAENEAKELCGKKGMELPQLTLTSTSIRFTAKGYGE